MKNLSDFNLQTLEHEIKTGQIDAETASDIFTREAVKTLLPSHAGALALVCFNQGRKARATQNQWAANYNTAKAAVWAKVGEEWEYAFTNLYEQQHSRSDAEHSAREFKARR